MKFKKHLYPLLICVISLFTITSCSKEDSPSDKEEEYRVKNPYYAHKIALEDFTSIGCQFCPYASFLFSEIEKTKLADKIITVAIHDDFGNTKDPWMLPQSYQYAVEMKVRGYPSIFCNRNNNTWPTNVFIEKYKKDGKFVDFLHKENFEKYVKSKDVIRKGSNIGIKIGSELTQTSGDITVNIKFSEDIKQKLKYVVYVLEDGLIGKQYNGTNLYGNDTGKNRWEENFVHNNTLLGSNNILGDDIDTSLTTVSEEVTKIVNIKYKATKVENLKVVVLILDSIGNVLNAQSAKGNTVKDYEVAKK